MDHPDLTELKVDVAIIKATSSEVARRLGEIEAKMVSRAEYEALNHRLSKLENVQGWVVKTVATILVAALLGLVLVKPVAATHMERDAKFPQVMLYRDKETDP